MEFPIHGGVVLIDEESLPKVLGLSWRLDGKGYGIRTVHSRRDGRARVTTELMHRRIIGAKPGQIVDHINRVRTDNRLCNLRFVNHAENSLNRAFPPTTPKGNVCRHRCGRWQAAFSYRERYHYLGLYDDHDEASAVVAYARSVLRSGGELPPRHELRALAAVAPGTTRGET